MSDLLDKLLIEVERGELLTDPRCGKHEAAVLTNVQPVRTETTTRLELTWSDLIDPDGQPFEHIQRLFLPDPQAHVVTKIRFLSTLKALGIIPKTRKEMLYFTDDQVDDLAAAIWTCVAARFFRFRSH